MNEKIRMFLESLTGDEKAELTAHLLNETKWTEHGIDPRIFRAGTNKFVSVPVELCVLDKDGRVLTFYRKDDEYDGHHMPGTVLRDNEKMSDAINRLLKSEVVGGKIKDVQNIGVTEIVKGAGPGQNPTRHEISVLFLAYLDGEYKGRDGVFSPMDKLPENILPHHRVLVEKFREFIRTGKPVLIG